MGSRGAYGRRGPHYPQDDDSPLCCCEYYNRRGERSHVLACCCACDELDAAADRLIRDWGLPSDHASEVLQEMDDRFRLPFPGGAWHIGFYGTVPWLVVPLILAIGAKSATLLVLDALFVVPFIVWCHRRGLKMRKRSRFLTCWMLASLAFESLVYGCTVAQSLPTSACATWVALVIASLVFFGMCCVLDPSSTDGVADAAGAVARAVRCPLSGQLVPRCHPGPSKDIGASSKHFYHVSEAPTCHLGTTIFACGSIDLSARATIGTFSPLWHA